jgi:site-specific DNA-cytosine methylase
MTKPVHVDMAEIEAMIARAKAATAEIALQNDSDGAQARMGTAVQHAFTRQLAVETNRNTDNELISDALAAVCANMICDFIASTRPADATLEQMFPYVETQLSKTAYFLAQRFEGRSRRISSGAVRLPAEGRTRMIELIVDSFAGGGGASTGIEMALGRSPDIAINHDATALAMHEVNHPATTHLVSDVWEVDPVEVTAGRPVGLAWFSPDCKHFSKAKGGKPVEKKIRGLAWVVVHWANVVAPRVIILENVEEFATWGPLGADNKPCPLQKGLTFKRWLSELERLGYVVEWRELRACDYGAPTLRKRLFLIARCDGEPIVWPVPTHKRVKAYRDGRADVEKLGSALVPDVKPARVAAEIIDWSLPCPSIFDTAKQIKEKYGLRAVRPLQKATMARLAKGVRRYVVDAAKAVHRQPDASWRRPRGINRRSDGHGYRRASRREGACDTVRDWRRRPDGANRTAQRQRTCADADCQGRQCRRDAVH